MKQVYIKFAMHVMHWREKAGVLCGFTLLPSGGKSEFSALLRATAEGPTIIAINYGK